MDAMNEVKAIVRTFGHGRLEAGELRDIPSGHRLRTLLVPRGPLIDPARIMAVEITETVKHIEKLTAHADVQSREYNGRWYTDVKAWNVVRENSGGAPCRSRPEHDR